MFKNICVFAIGAAAGAAIVAVLVKATEVVVETAAESV